MFDVLLTFYCAPHDADMIALLLRAECGCAVHVLEERVYGMDFGDARMTEQVSGRLNRCKIQALVKDNQVAGLVSLIDGSNRDSPVRWHVVRVEQQGRLS